MDGIASKLGLSPRKISAGYFIFGILWIVSTDYLVLVLVESQSLVSQIQTAKAWVFVVVSTAFVFVVTSVHKRQTDNAYTKLELANQQLQVLHRVFRHNIRNDLNVIRGYTDLVREYVSDRDVESRLETIQTRAKNIVRISEKLTVVDDVDPSIADPIRVDLGSIVSDELDRLEYTSPQVSVLQRMPDEALVVGDESIQFVVREVLENAIEHFDGPLETCEIAVSGELHGSEVVLEIVDNGSGIPAHEIDAISSNEETPLVHASSIGLWLVTWICRIHDATIEFESLPDSGTVVTISFRSGSTKSTVESNVRRFRGEIVTV